MEISMPGAPLVRVLAAVLAALTLAACADSTTPAAGPLLTASVSAAAGGRFTDPASPPRFAVDIPAGALAADATLTVVEAAAPPAAAALTSSASPAFEVKLTTAAGAPVALGSPMTVEVAATPAPVHPQLGEVNVLAGGAWQRIHASFWKPSAGRVLALTSASSGTFRAVLRSRQLASGPGVAAGFRVFMYETFGNEAFFGGVVGLHTVLNGVAPVDAVALGAQVDLARVPDEIKAVMTGTNYAAKAAALGNPATTRALIKAGAVVGVEGRYATSAPTDDTLVSVGLTCALCHQKVTPTAFQLSAPPAAATPLPIGPLSVDGVPNEKMDAGKILSFTPFAVGAGQATVDLLAGWGPNRFDVRALPDNVLDDLVDNPTDTPPLWNFLDLEAQGYGFGWDGLFKGADALASQAEAVYDLVMHANGAFGTSSGSIDPALAVTPPAALLTALAKAETDAPGNDVDRQKLLDLQTWMRSVPSPAPGAHDAVAAERGFRLFYGKGGCAGCHSTPDLTGPGLFNNITEVPPDGDLAGGVHIPSLRGVSHTAPYFHDDSADTLPAAVARVATVLSGFGVVLTPEEQAELVEYLKSL
jgi:mono/diheme cytochrome c family protein